MMPGKSVDVEIIDEAADVKQEYVRPAYLDCEHVFKDITKEREQAVQANPLPQWYVNLMEDPKNYRKPTISYARLGEQKFEQCTICDMVKVGAKDPKE